MQTMCQLGRRAAHFGANDRWYCHPDPLPLAKAIAIDTRSYTSRWDPFDLSSAPVLEAKATRSTPGKACLGIKLGAKIYWSAREAKADGCHVRDVAIGCWRSPPPHMGLRVVK
jgi:hypothetical protein